MASAKPTDNPWYALATLHGEPGDIAPPVSHVHEKNRETWNRWYASALTDEQREELIKADRVRESELVPFSADELLQFETEFASHFSQLKLPRLEDDIRFDGLQTRSPMSFNGFLFVRPAAFIGVQFQRSVDFAGTTFLAKAMFDGLICKDISNFFGAMFGANASFQRSIFNSDVDFSNTTFAKLAFFTSANFSGPTVFHKASFTSKVVFESAKFSSLADFRKVDFAHDISFNNAEFGTTTLYTDAKFRESPPTYFGSGLHQNTDWWGISWPKPKTSKVANSYVRAYERLKLEMDGLRKIDDELNFLALELQCKAVRDRGLKACLIRIYGLISDYGRSIWRPLLCMFLVWLSGFLSTYLSCTLTAGRAAAISASNLVGFFGFNRAYIESGVLQTLPEWTKILFASQTLLAAPLLFLALLALRNRFRIK